MKVLHLISSSGFFGAENVTLNLLNSLKDNQSDPRLLCIKNSGKPDPAVYLEAGKRGISTGVITCKKRFDMAAINRIKDFIRENNIDVVHSHGYKSNLYGMIASRMAHVPIVTTLHGWMAEDYKARFYEMLDKLLIRRMDHVVSVSPATDVRTEGRGLLRRLPSARLLAMTESDKFSFIPNGVDTDKFDPSVDGPDFRAIFGADNALVIGTVGRMGPEKGHLYLLMAFKEVSSMVPEARLLMVGGGDMEEILQRKAEELGIIDKVEFMGNQYDMAAAYRTMDIFVLPSLIEGTPMVLLEAMSMGLPVIASNVGGIPHVIAEGEGILVPPRDTTGLGLEIFRLLEDGELRRKIGKEARKKILMNYSLQSFFKRYVDTYKKILS